jgi:predicted RNA binding protein YcfA (HicA-like mRNA interferase family)
MTRLPILSGRKVVKALCTIGYIVINQRGSHIHLQHPERPPLTVPDHKEIARGTLRAIIREADLTVEEFLKVL